MTTVDAHAHLVPQQLLDAIEESGQDLAKLRRSDAGVAIELRGAPPTRPLKPALIEVDSRRAWMDEHGVDVQIVGTWADLFGYHLNADRAARWTELVTRTLLEAADGDDRLRVLAALPLQEPDSAATQLTTAVADGCVGAMIGTQVGDGELDDRRLDPVWRAATEADVPIFIHPGLCDDPRLVDMGLVNAVGRGNDTTITGARILLGGVLDRHPDLKLVLSHGGAALPVLLGRLARNHAITDGTADPRPGFGRLYFDSVVLDAPALEHLCRVAAPGHVLLGSDYPFPIGDLAPRRVVDATQLPQEVKDGICTDADALFSRSGAS